MLLDSTRPHIYKRNNLPKPDAHPELESSSTALKYTASTNTESAMHISTKWILGGHMTLATPFIGNFVRGHVQTVPGNMHVKFEVCSFSHVGAKPWRVICTQTYKSKNSVIGQCSLHSSLGRYKHSKRHTSHCWNYARRLASAAVPVYNTMFCCVLFCAHQMNQVNYCK